MLDGFEDVLVRAHCDWGKMNEVSMVRDEVILLYFISGVGDLQGCGHRLLPRGVGLSKFFSKASVQ